MGNRAYVVFQGEKENEFSPAVYLHWNGGPESIYAFMEEMDRRQIRGRDSLSYQTARFIQMVGEFLHSEFMTSLGVEDAPKSLEDLVSLAYCCDNGLYLVTRIRRPEKLVMRRFFGKGEKSRAWVNTERKKVYGEELGQSYLKDIGKRLQLSGAVLSGISANGHEPVADLLERVREGDASARDPFIDALLTVIGSAKPFQPA